MAIKIKNKKMLAYVILAALCITGITLLVLPADYFDEGQALCLSVLLLDRECYGCGMTRAIQHLIHLDFAEAWSYNKMSYIVLPLAVYMILYELRKLLTEPAEQK
jgi:hypothetical protein